MVQFRALVFISYPIAWDSATGRYQLKLQHILTLLCVFCTHQIIFFSRLLEAVLPAAIVFWYPLKQSWPDMHGLRQSFGVEVCCSVCAWRWLWLRVHFWNLVWSLLDWVMLVMTYPSEEDSSFVTCCSSSDVSHQSHMVIHYTFCVHIELSKNTQTCKSSS